jgi:hypothetical protein
LWIALLVSHRSTSAFRQFHPIQPPPTLPATPRSRSNQVYQSPPPYVSMLTVRHPALLVLLTGFSLRQGLSEEVEEEQAPSRATNNRTLFVIAVLAIIIIMDGRYARTLKGPMTQRQGSERAALISRTVQLLSYQPKTITS